MPGVSELNASFDFYEGIRILLPGALAAGLADAIIRTTRHVSSVPTLESAVVAGFIALGAGLFLYFLDLPAKSPAYFKDLPTDFILQTYRDKSRWDNKEIINVYFVILDTELPAGIKARVLYMGSMFRIGFEAILLFAGAQYAIWIDASLHDESLRSHPLTKTLTISPTIDLMTVATLVLLAVLVLGVAAFTRPPANPPLSRSKRFIWPATVFISDQTKPSATIILVSAALIIVGILEDSSRSMVIGAGLLAAVWTWRLLLGTGLGGLRTHQPVNRLTSLTLLAASSGTLIAASTFKANHSVVTTGPTYAGWIAATLIACLLIISRGHERRLHGVYQTQRKWLEMNTPLLDRYYLAQESSVPPVAGRAVRVLRFLGRVVTWVWGWLS